MIHTQFFKSLSSAKEVKLLDIGHQSNPWAKATIDQPATLNEEVVADRIELNRFPKQPYAVSCIETTF
ncbi:hypothetical protein D3C71_1763310 [compost metagenome]